MNLVYILIKHAAIDRAEIIKTIETIQEEIDKITETENIKKLKESMVERLKKHKDKIKVRKVSKFARDQAHYANGHANITIANANSIARKETNRQTPLATAAARESGNKDDDTSNVDSNTLSSASSRGSLINEQPGTILNLEEELDVLVAERLQTLRLRQRNAAINEGTKRDERDEGDIKKMHRKGKNKYGRRRSTHSSLLCSQDILRRNQLFYPAYLRIYTNCAVEGGSLIQVSIGPLIHFTIPACEYFTEITFACLQCKSMEELRKWLKNEPDAVDCSHVIKLFCELQGSSETWIEKQKMVQQKVKQVYKCDMDRRDPLFPAVLPQADCLFLVDSLVSLAKDMETFCDGLKNLSQLLKCGGHLKLMTALEATFHMVGDVKFPHLCIDEGFLRTAFTDAGYVIKEHQIINRKVQCLYDVMDYNGVIIVKACKEKHS
ncbi:indolethylamine N-methyltransferase-like [Lissotriton helveticus]